MIVCHQYKFIFIKTSKSAGTSVEIALSQFCGEGDIIAPISSKDQKTRARAGYPGPQNCYSPPGDYRANDIARFLLKGKRKLRYYNHMSAGEVRDRIGQDAWDGYFKFCFVRNPWDRVISLYYHRFKTEPRPSIREFIDSGALDDLKRLGPDLYRIDGTVAVDHVYKYEHLADELQSLRATLALPVPLELVNAKGGFRKDRKSFHDVLNKEEIAEISKTFSEEIESMQYDARPPSP